MMDVMNIKQVLAALRAHARNEWPLSNDRAARCVFAIEAYIASDKARAADDAAIGSAYRSWYASAKGYRNVVADSAHDAIMSAATQSKEKAG